MNDTTNLEQRTLLGSATKTHKIALKKGGWVCFLEIFCSAHSAEADASYELQFQNPFTARQNTVNDNLIPELKLDIT